MRTRKMLPAKPNLIFFCSHTVTSGFREVWDVGSRYAGESCRAPELRPLEQLKELPRLPQRMARAPPEVTGGCQRGGLSHPPEAPVYLRSLTKRQRIRRSRSKAVFSLTTIRRGLLFFQGGTLMCDSPRGALVHLPSAGRVPSRAKRGWGAFPRSPQTREAVAPNSSRPAPSGNGITLARVRVRRLC